MTIRGVTDTLADVPFGGGRTWQTVKMDLSKVTSIRPGRARSDAEYAKPFTVNNDDLVEVEFHEGMKIWMRVEEFREAFKESAKRSQAEPGCLEAPEYMPFRPSGHETRGAVSWAVKSLKFFGIDLAKHTAASIGGMVEDRNPGNRPCFSRLHLETGKFGTEPAVKQDTTDQPFLVFIHGTLSSTWGSFGALWSDERCKELDAIRRTYGDRVYAFDHRTLTESPLQNASQLLDMMNTFLPRGARVHLVSHSRGGLVGELICRTLPLVDTGHRADFEKACKNIANGDRYVKELSKLEKDLRKKTFTVERFVRVACPTLGTTLASGRLDRWLNVMGAVLGSALPGTPMFSVFEDIAEFIATVVKERTKVNELPGLEAMMPESPFIRLVNWPTAKAEGELAVIAGDIEPDKWWAKLLVWASDRFYDSDHDLVVNTPSMYHGAERLIPPGMSEYVPMLSFHKGPDVNHFHYFTNEKSARAMILALEGRTEVDSNLFEKLQPVPVVIAREAKKEPSHPKSIVFLIPGIMGSTLSQDGDPVWLDVPDLAFGGFKQLDIDAQNVVATSVMTRYYDKLVRYLRANHIVVPLPYDWRMSIENQSTALFDQIMNTLAKRDTHLPVRIIAHSMGGLVARGMMAHDPEAWKALRGQRDLRLIMLGTPNGGSHSITELLVAKSSTLTMLSMLDLTHDAEDLLGYISRFPGVLDLLPGDDNGRFFDPSMWKTFAAADGKGWKVPPAGALSKAWAYRRKLEGIPLDPGTTVYVAGHAAITPVTMALDKNRTPGKRIVLYATSRGDGKVPWESGIPQGVPTYFMDAEHGDLASTESAFAAIEDLVVSGFTARLPREAPVSRAATEHVELMRDEQMLYPDREAIETELMGSRPSKRHRPERDMTKVHVSVVHGNLAFARHPIIVGHYIGDPIVSAERFIDRELGGILSEYHRMKIYPEEIESCKVFQNPDIVRGGYANLRGAIVAGLGPAGKLSAAQLSRTLSVAMRAYALEWIAPRCDETAGTPDPHADDDAIPEEQNAASRQKKPRKRASGMTELTLSSLLIGSGEGGIPIHDTVSAILRAVIAANQALCEAGVQKRITSLELVELWEDRAVAAGKALIQIARESDFSGRLVIDTRVENRKGSARRIHMTEEAGWWQRLQILGNWQEGEDGPRVLRFSALTKRARSEVRILAAQRETIDIFVKKTITRTQSDISSAKTLFELLLPNELKEVARDQDNLILILDEDAAQYPWELLQDPLEPNGKPFCVRSGLLRQLESKIFRESPRQVVEHHALIIGDPISSFVELPGAQKEAEAVHRILKQSRFDAVDCLIRPDGERALAAIYQKPYKILHLAGHGRYKEEDVPVPAQGHGPVMNAGSADTTRNVSGMILDDKIVLTPALVEQMRGVPELVFINCCHLGRIEDASADETLLHAHAQYNRIAANVATQFIRMGVRAIIAAGWAVDDESASLFAKTFYGGMIAGEKFGDAITEARRVVYEANPSTNTWGAYQCYGDPEYRFWAAPDSATAGSDEFFVSSPEVESRIGELTVWISLATKDRLEALKANLRRIEEHIPVEWRMKGGILAALARAYGEAEEFDRAVALYAEAAQAEEAAMTLRDVEQWANLQARLALQTLKQSKRISTKQWKSFTDDIQDAIARIEKLDTNTERLNLLGSAYKRWAWGLALSGVNPAAELRNMEERYREAAGRIPVGGNGPLYGFNNLMTAKIARSLQAGKPTYSWAALAKELQSKDEVFASVDMKDFWSSVLSIDFALLKAIVSGHSTGEGIEDLAGKYLEARKRASAREFRSVLDQLGFLSAMSPAKSRLRKSLDQLTKELEGSLS